MLSEVPNQSYSVPFITNQNVKVSLKAEDRLNLIEHFTTAINRQIEAYKQLRNEELRKLLIGNRRTLRKFFREELKPIPFAILAENKDTITHVEESIMLHDLNRRLDRL